MADEFKGNPVPLRDADYARAARDLGCSVAALRAVASVESAGGGFLPDGRPKILFERHVFHRRTKGRFSAAHPNISHIERGGYLGGVREYDRLRRAIALDRKAALESASWGKFQLMGFNHQAAGHSSIDGFVSAIKSGEPAQLDGFVTFIRSRGLDDELRRQDWTAFARGYNGPAFAENAYDRRMAAAFAAFTPARPSAAPVLQLGDSGEAVSRLQSLLGLKPDGAFGPETKTAVTSFQKARGIMPDGVVGAGTWAALLA